MRVGELINLIQQTLTSIQQIVAGICYAPVGKPGTKTVRVSKAALVLAFMELTV